MIRIEETIYKNRYNLIDDEFGGSDRYLRQFSKEELVQLSKDINDVLSLGDEK